MPSSTLAELDQYFQSKLDLKKKSEKPLPTACTKKGAHSKSRVILSPRRDLPLDFKKKLLVLYYGSMTNFDKPLMRQQLICQIFRVHPATMSGIVKRFAAAGKNMDAYTDKRKEKVRNANITPEMHRHILDPAVLQAWAGKTLTQRTFLLQEKFNIKVSYTMLRNMYHEYGIKNRPTQIVYRASLIKKDVLEPRRREFELELGNIIRHQLPLLYLDESSVHCETTLGRCWSYSDKPVNVPINTGSRLSCTIFATIGTCIQGGFASTYEESTNGEAFLRHLVQLKKQLRDPSERPFLVLDGARAHHAIVARDYLEEGFRPLRLPSYSPQYNSVEALWSVVKKKVRIVLLREPTHNLNLRQFRAIV